VSTLKVVRTTTLVVCAAGIAGMIVTSALNHNGAAITFGILTAVAILCSMVATAVANDASRRLGGRSPAEETERVVDTMAAVVEEQVGQLVERGTDESALRQLVGEAVRLGRTLARTGS
jgi:hypothetical protein